MSDTVKITKFIEFQPIEKRDEEKREVKGIVLKADTFDLQGEKYTASTIRKAMTRFMRDFQQVGIMHTFKANGVFIIENIQKDNGDWHMTLKVENDSIWDKIKSGILTGLSIGGRAHKVPIAT